MQISFFYNNIFNINDIQAQRHVIGEGNILKDSNNQQQQQATTKYKVSYACKFNKNVSKTGSEVNKMF